MSTKVTSMAVVDSTVDNTPIGANTPSSIVATGLVISAANGGVELGSVAALNTPFVDFHSSGNNVDYDVRLLASGGSPAVGAGTITIEAAEVHVPTPTPATDNSTKAATTAWCLAGFAILLGTSGYIQFPSWMAGLLIQWALGTTSVNGRGQYAVNWPKAFPNNFFGASATVRFDNQIVTDNWQGAAFYVQPNSTKSVCQLQYDVRSDGAADSTYRPFVIGVGN